MVVNMIIDNNSHLNGFGCTGCSNFSNGENNIKCVLNKLVIKYNTQKSFIGCKDKNKLCFDFYLINENSCIEFDGIQHYKPINYFGDTKTFDNVKKEGFDKK